MTKNIPTTKSSKSVLVVDDEPMIREAVSSLFESRGFAVFTAATGTQALEIFDAKNISLVILDLMLPKMSGEDVCARLRKKSRVPIIMLTAKVAEAEVIEGLGRGADDYVTKPFSLKELYARAEAVMRRAEDDLLPLTTRNSWGDGDLLIDFSKGEVQKRGVNVELTPSELGILSALIKYPGKIFSRRELTEVVLNKSSTGYDRIVDNHIKNIRKKIENDPKHPVYLLTVSGLGYKFGGK